ncbi:hypothetical protein D9V37_05800 [Nocardioides mangrovicus]|uniref:MmcQ/YjbR family DNA-binding protein n=1 Tax=Nocardioides mangrovicus TaxID=2478913 RepID=A0A3L8P496_9ACTN|nr:hypothetical protein [Nocardioides mangrovicus]RLV50230.1 hypothetical protein D9V37_05800 [Nocardioides mangrovicus]
MKATPDDVEAICAGLPRTEKGVSWGDRPTWRVTGGKRKSGFLLYRAPGRTAIDPATGEPYDDLLVIHVPDADAKVALVEDDGPFFTIEHFDGFNAVLVQLSRLGEIEREELVEVITEAWATDAPKALVKEHLGQ